jgi:hypothetical protein
MEHAYQQEQIVQGPYTAFIFVPKMHLPPNPRLLGLAQQNMHIKSTNLCLT